MHVACAKLNPHFDDKFLVIPVSGTTDRVAIELNCIAAAVRSALKDRLFLGTIDSGEQDPFSQIICDVLDDNCERSRARAEKSAAGEILRSSFRKSSVSSV